VITKAALSPQLFKDPECWSGRDLNLRPSAHQSGALPTELTGRRLGERWITDIRVEFQKKKSNSKLASKKYPIFKNKLCQLIHDEITQIQDVQEVISIKLT